MKKKFENEQEVIDLIDGYREGINQTIDRIEQVNFLADRLRYTMEAYRIERLRSDAETMRREIAWRNGRLETLKEILAEIRTPLLPFGKLNNLDPAPDASVTMEVEGKP